MRTQSQKAADFAAMHAAPGCFVIPNPWDLGTARILAGLGFKALTTTSIGYARSLGVTDYQAGRDSVLAHIRLIATGVDLPLAADLENGFGHAPKDCADTIRLGAEAGLVGGSIEDATGDKASPIYDLNHAVERIAAAAEAARALPFKFTLVARAENYLNGRQDFDDTLMRCQAFVRAGADVIFAPGLNTAEEVRTLCREGGAPVNLVASPRKEPMDVAGVAALGVKRISLGGLLHTAAMTGFVNAAKELAASGTYGFGKTLTPGAEIDALLKKGAG